MKICCGSYHEPLQNTDIVVIDIPNGLCHYICLEIHPSLIQDIDTYQNMQEKYDFFREKLIH